LPDPTSAQPRGSSPREVARLLRVSPDRVRAMIKSGRLGALNLGTLGRDRFVVLPEHLAAFAAANRAANPPKPARRRRSTPAMDFYPD
jgi:excisionase family DNA binding protein